MKLIFLIVSIVLFLIAAVVAYGTGTVEHSAALVPLGLAFLAASFLPVSDRIS